MWIMNNLHRFVHVHFIASYANEMQFFGSKSESKCAMFALLVHCDPEYPRPIPSAHIVHMNRAIRSVSFVIDQH